MMVDINISLLGLLMITLWYCRKYKKLSEKDVFTNAYHKHWFNTNLVYEMRKAKLKNQTMGIAFIDLDNFRILNNTKGHDYGDYVLTSVVRSIRSVIRKQTSVWGFVERDKDMLVRYGGDEFVLIASDVTEETFPRILSRLQECIRNTGLITASIGGTMFSPVDEINFSGLIKKADEAVYDAKKKGRDCVVLTPPTAQLYPVGNICWSQLILNWITCFKQIKSLDNLGV